MTFFYPKQHICLSYRKGKKNNSVVVILALCFCGWMNWGRRNRATLKGESFECQTNMFSSRSTSTHSWINYILLLRRYQEFMQEKGRRLPIIDIYFLYACINIYYIILFFLLFNISRKHRLLEPEVENIFFWLSIYQNKIVYEIWKMHNYTLRHEHVDFSGKRPTLAVIKNKGPKTIFLFNSLCYRFSSSPRY